MHAINVAVDVDDGDSAGLAAWSVVAGVADVFMAEAWRKGGIALAGCNLKADGAQLIEGIDHLMGKQLTQTRAAALARKVRAWNSLTSPQRRNAIDNTAALAQWNDLAQAWWQQARSQAEFSAGKGGAALVSVDQRQDKLAELLALNLCWSCPVAAAAHKYPCLLPSSMSMKSISVTIAKLAKAADQAPEPDSWGWLEEVEGAVAAAPNNLTTLTPVYIALMQCVAVREGTEQVSRCERMAGLAEMIFMAAGSDAKAFFLAIWGSPLYRNPLTCLVTHLLDDASGRTPAAALALVRTMFVLAALKMCATSNALDAAPARMRNAAKYAEVWMKRAF